MAIRFEAAGATAASHGAMGYQQRTETGSAIDPPPAKPPRIQDHLAIEASRLIDDVRRALESDFGVATRTAARLAALLASKSSDEPRPGPARGGLAPWQERKIRRAIEKGLEGALPVEDLARVVSLSPSYFCRAFKESFGEPPHAYIIKQRVERARILMLTTSESLSQIALACGLVDQAHLCRCFRQVMGVPPGAWRRHHATGPLSFNPMTTMDEMSFGIQAADAA